MDGHSNSNSSAVEDMKVYTGTLVHATEENPMLILEDKVLGVCHGKIEFVAPATEVENLKAKYNFSDANVTALTSSQFLMPGLVDSHIHAPQFPNNGIHLDLPLLEWLQNYTFPTEARFCDLKYARAVYAKAVDRVLRSGTTTASYFGSMHLEATKILSNIVLEKGQRAFVGKVNMMVNCPEDYRELSVDESAKETEDFILYVKSLNSPLVQPIVTPRFAPTCPKEQLERLGQLAAKHDCHIQSHLCESQAEKAWVKDLFAGSKNYADVYHTAGLLTNKTVMAHCVWLDDEEVALVKGSGTGVSHCPNSNMSLRSGMCNVRRLLKAGLKVGLGTDCSGGFSPSILNALRMAVLMSKGLSAMSNAKHLTLEESFRLATLGGAKVLHLEDRIGNFEVKKEFDALLIDVEAKGTPFDIFPEDTTEEKIQKFLYNGDDRNILQVFVAGQKVVDQMA
ncbi:guanine deaminase-like [Penaeus japonicus]|uniref:guanine deaminase-like n=1 Tax=Penaeus japonicus TaxID=27405 RepID=UPI001C70B43A|nr:guanine deaminase-like [Penaeus japonicus]XP_042886177.1 guanine deaminase-like [Penaeus japonicus]XP_042886178.1 guanine deaminase-like [Penaeus japonicus]XP_042886179.1 guanine deaminase-like [Penaeus japonicus]XP_042886180.1 guanine deaminase-like [Penaeus japonicus]XP_042886181.1 guanine deaminase-like [Penaeus japonicus]XP_042886182.1 guanine deaminase-like [Penaeus japonicus]XP_042886183.1 guanine deaminase-like [Penaeus japonicus]